MLRARSQGLHVVAVGALVRTPLTSIISLPKAKIDGPKDLEGKTVGTAGIDYQHAYLQTILQQANVPPTSVKERTSASTSCRRWSGKVDAILGGFWNYEAIDLQQRKKTRGHPPRGRRRARLRRAGVRRQRGQAGQSGPLIRRFMTALRRGEITLRHNPALGVNALLKANPDLDPKLQAASVKATLPYFSPPPGKPYGYQDPAKWKKFATWMTNAGRSIERGSDVGASTNAIPAAG